MRKHFSIYAAALLILLSGMSESAFAQKKDKKKKKKGESEQVTLTPDMQEKLARLFMDAERAKVIEDFETAIQKYKEVIAISPDNANAHFQLAQIYSGIGKFGDAADEGKKASALDPNNAWFSEMLGTVYMRQGNNKAAAEVFEQLIKAHPSNPEYYMNLAFLYAKDEKLQDAIRIYDAFEKNFGVDENVVLEKQKIYLHLNKFDAAMNELQKLVDEYPEDADYLLMQAEMYRANRMDAKALEVYKKILATAPDNPEALMAMADLGSPTGDNTQRVESIKKIFANPNVNVDEKIRILFPYVQFWELKKAQKADAFALAEILTNTHPDEAKAFSIQGDLFYLDEQNDKALASYLESLKLRQDVFQVWQQVILIYNDKREWEKLQKTCADALELFPNQALIYFFKGGAEAQLKDFERAVKTLSRGEKMCADNDKLRAQFFSNLGDAYHNIRDFNTSDSCYERSLQLDPANAFVLNNYSYYLSLRKDKLERAKEMSAQANKLEPDNSSFEDTYAWILFQADNLTEAREWQEKAIRSGGEKSGTILEHYGDILFKLGEKDKAVDYWKKAKGLGVESNTIHRKIAEQRYVE